MIAFVILHYQAITETILCVDSIKTNVSGKKKIVIVDNASPNCSGYDLQKRYINDNDITVLLSNKNNGFAKGNNWGYQECKKYSPKFIVVLNSDTLIQQSNFADLVVEAYSKYTFDVLGPDIISTKTSLHQNPQREKNYTLQELKKMHRKLFLKNKLKWLIWLKYALHINKIKPKTNPQKITEIQTGKVLHGAFYIFSEKFIKKHSVCFYDKTFMYYESYILHYLGIKENMLFLYYPAIQILHAEDASTNNTYKNQYKKSVFVNRCLLDSCTKFIELQNKEMSRLE